MAKIFKIVNPRADLRSWKRDVGSGAAATIAQGTPTKDGGSGNVAIMADGNGTTSERFTGIAKTTSNDTASADGTVVLWFPDPGIVYAGKPKVAGAADTAAEIADLVGKRTVFDLTSSDWTIDAAAGDGATNTVVIVGGQPEEDILYFVVSPTGLVLE